jgi:hypothetical protein
MTFVGRILVIVIMIFSVIFLGIATVVFSTSKNWARATQDERKKVEDFKKKLADAQAGKDAASKELEVAKGSFDGLAKGLNGRIATLEADNKHDIEQITAVRGQLATALQNEKAVVAEVEARRKETNLLRDQKAAVEKQANEFKLHEAELNDRIRELERMLETATKNNADLRDRVVRFSTLLRQNGLSDDITQIRGVESPPPVEGEVKRVDPTNRRVEISIGSDDGLVPGQEFLVYRMKPRPEFVAKISIISVESDQAVGVVVGRTYQGKKIAKGDTVASSLRK